MAINISNRNSCREAKNCKKHQEILADEIALRDEILELKRQVMVLKRTNERNLVKFRKYEDEAKRKDREIEQLMDPRKNADITKVLSTKGAAILMTLKDQNNALIQMVLNKDVQIKRLLAEMKMSKLYASTRRSVPYKEEIARLKTLLVKCEEQLKENLDKESQAKSASANESSILEFSSSGQSSPRDLDDLRSVMRSLEAHLKYSNDLLNRKDREISLLTDELNFLKKLLQHKTSKKKTFDCHPVETRKYSIHDTHSVPQTRVSDNVPQPENSAELLQLFEESADYKTLSNSAPASFTRLPPHSNDFLSKHKSLSSITGNEKWKETKCSKEDKTIGEDTAKVNAPSKLEKGENVRGRKKILMRHRDPKRKIPKKFSGRSSAKRKRFHENGRKNRNTQMLEEFESKEGEKEGNGEMVKEKEFEIKTEIFLRTENSGFDDFRTFRREGERADGTENNFRDDREWGDAEKESGSRNSVDRSERNLIMDGVSEENSEVIEINLPVKQENCKMSEEETDPFNIRREIYRESFDSSFESENGNPTKQEVQQVQVEVQIDSIPIQNDADEWKNSLWENSHQEKFTETRGNNLAPGDCENNNNDDDNDVVTR